MNCNQCEYLFIQGVGCHETGCPNIVKKIECFICGLDITKAALHSECFEGVYDEDTINE